MFRYREARAHAVIAATILWALAAVLVFTGAGYRSFTGRLKGTDFVHFYTLGHLALTGDSGRLYDPVGQHAVQVSLVPESDPEWYFPVYPPQVALVFAPLARWSYGTAAVLWGLVTITLYALVVCDVPGIYVLHVAFQHFIGQQPLGYMRIEPSSVGYQ